MNRTWSAIVIAAAGGFILLILAFQDIATPGAVIWEPAMVDGRPLERADGLVLQDERDGVLLASDGSSIYRSEGDRGFLKVHTVKPPLGTILAGHSRTLRALLRLQEAIEVVGVDARRMLVFVGGDIRLVDLQTGTGRTVHRLRYHGRGEGRGVMPFGIARDRDGRIYYGEYVTRSLGGDETVALFRSDDGGESFRIAHEFEPGTVRHIHAVQWDPYEGVLWLAAGADDEQSRIGFSRDLGETFVWIGEGGQDVRAVNLVFSKDHVTWLSDSVEAPPRVLRLHRENRAIEASPSALPGHGLYIQGIDGGFVLGTAEEETASLWLIDPDLRIAKILEWPPGEAKSAGSGTLRLARGRPAGGGWLHVSALRGAEKEPAIYRLSKSAVFAAAGIEPPKSHRMFSRDQP